MPCPTCESDDCIATAGVYWCANCGTIFSAGPDPQPGVPKLTQQVRDAYHSADLKTLRRIYNLKRGK